MSQSLSDEIHTIPVDIHKDGETEIVRLISAGKANMRSGSNLTQSANGRNHGTHAS